MITVVTAIVLAYLAGAIPWSFLAGKRAGIDLRRVGSGNLGATNTYRALGARVAVGVLVLDILKGLAAPLGFARLRLDAPALETQALAALCGAAAILGHIFPVYLGFRGGKGIATSGGVFLGLQPLACALAAAGFALGVLATRGIVSVGSLLSSLVLPLAIWAVGSRSGQVPWVHVAVAAALALLIWIKHASNLVRLVHGSEKSIFASRPKGTVG